MSQKPVFKLFIKHKETKVKHDILVVWPTDYDGLFNVKILPDMEGDKPTMLITTFLRLIAGGKIGDYFVSAATGFGGGDGSRPGGASPAVEFKDDDLPF